MEPLYAPARSGQLEYFFPESVFMTLIVEGKILSKIIPKAQ